MTLEEEILIEHSKWNVTRVAGIVGDDKEKFAELMRLFFKGSYRVVQYSAWILKHVHDEHPQMILPYIPELLNYLKRDVHDAIKRNGLLVLMTIDIPEEHLGKAANICFEYLSDKSQAIAIHANAMSVLLNIVKKEPDLNNELRLHIEELLPYASTGLKNRAMKILATLEKLSI